MSTWEKRKETILYIYAYRVGGNADKTNVSTLFPPQPANSVGVSHLKRHALHWEHGFIYLNTPTMQEVVSPRSEQRDWVSDTSSRSQRAKLVRADRIKDESPPISIKPEHNPSALRVSGPGIEDGMVGWVGGKARLQIWQPQLRAYRTGNPEIVANKVGNLQFPGDSYVS